MSQIDDQAEITVANLQTQIAASWQSFQTFLHGLTLND